MYSYLNLTIPIRFPLLFLIDLDYFPGNLGFFQFLIQNNAKVLVDEGQIKTIDQFIKFVNEGNAENLFFHNEKFVWFRALVGNIHFVVAMFSVMTQDRSGMWALLRRIRANQNAFKSTHLGHAFSQHCWIFPTFLFLSMHFHIHYVTIANVA